MTECTQKSTKRGKGTRLHRWGVKMVPPAAPVHENGTEKWQNIEPHSTPSFLIGCVLTVLCEGFLAPALNLKSKIRITKLCQSDGERPGGVIHALNVLPNSGYGCQWHDALLCCVQGMLHFSGMLAKKPCLSNDRQVNKSNEGHGGGYSACALDIYVYIYIYM